MVGGGCPVEMMGNEPCGRDAWDKDPEARCFFHSEEEKDPDVFLEAFLELVEAVDEGGVLDCARFVFPGGFCLPKDTELPTSDFSNATFGDETTFGGATFGDKTQFWDATFGDKTDFRGATFGDETDFRGATFGDKTDFWRATFGDKTDFRGATFGDETDFRGATFRDQTTFGHATFGDETAFRRTEFGEGTRFVWATLGREAAFHGATFRDEADFEGVGAGLGLSFRRARFKGAAHFVDLTLAAVAPGDGVVSLDFSRVQLSRRDAVRFIGVGRGDEPAALDLSGARFALTDVAMLRFLHVDWGEEGRIKDEDFLEASGSGDDTASTFRVTPRQIAAVYKGLRLSYERNLRYAEAGAFHIREMEMRRRAAVEESSTRPVGWLRSRFSLLNVYRLLSNYGESYRRASLWLLVALTLFTSLRLGLWTWPPWPLPPLSLGAIGGAVTDTLGALVQLRGQDASRIDTWTRLVGYPLILLFALAVRRNLRR